MPMGFAPMLDDGKSDMHTSRSAGPYGHMFQTEFSSQAPMFGDGGGMSEFGPEPAEEMAAYERIKDWAQRRFGAGLARGKESQASMQGVQARGPRKPWQIPDEMGWENNGVGNMDLNRLLAVAQQEAGHDPQMMRDIEILAATMGGQVPYRPMGP